MGRVPRVCDDVGSALVLRHHHHHHHLYRPSASSSLLCVGQRSPREKSHVLSAACFLQELVPLAFSLLCVDSQYVQRFVNNTRVCRGNITRMYAYTGIRAAAVRKGPHVSTSVKMTSGLNHAEFFVLRVIRCTRRSFTREAQRYCVEV